MTQGYVTKIYLLFRFKFKRLLTGFNQFKQNTVGARIPNAFGFRMVDVVRFMVLTVQIPNAKKKMTV